MRKFERWHSSYTPKSDRYLERVDEVVEDTNTEFKIKLIKLGVLIIQVLIVIGFLIYYR